MIRTKFMEAATDFDGTGFPPVSIKRTRPFVITKDFYLRININKPKIVEYKCLRKLIWNNGSLPYRNHPEVIKMWYKD